MANCVGPTNLTTPVALLLTTMTFSFTRTAQDRCALRALNAEAELMLLHSELLSHELELGSRGFISRSRSSSSSHGLLLAYSKE